MELSGHVKEMHHHGNHIWILYTSGYIAVFDMDSHEIIQNIKSQETSNDPVTILVDHATGLIATAYTNGLIITYLWDKSNSINDNVSMVYFDSSSKISYQKFMLTTAESCSDVDGHCQIWCGYSIGVIQIVSPPVKASEETKSLKVLRIDSYCTDLSPDTYITQFKFSGKELALMYALHDGGLVISCWRVGTTNPTLHSMIKISTMTPGKMLFKL